MRQYENVGDVILEPQDVDGNLSRNDKEEAMESVNQESKRGRKRMRNISTWKITVRKEARQRGLSYKTQRSQQNNQTLSTVISVYTNVLIYSIWMPGENVVNIII